MGLLGDFLEEMGELFTDGFAEMVLKDNNSYRTSKEKRDVADTLIRETQQAEKKALATFKRQLGVTRAAVEAYQTLCDSAVRDQLIPWDAVAAKYPEPLANEAITDLRKRFSCLEFLPPKRLRQYSASAASKVPGSASPSYETPALPWELMATLGAGLSSSYERHARVVASSKYLENAHDYVAAVDAQCLAWQTRASELTLMRRRIKEARVLLGSFSAMLADALAVSPQISDRRQFQLGIIAAAAIVAIIEQPLVDERGALVRMNDRLVAELKKAQSDLVA